MAMYVFCNERKGKRVHEDICKKCQNPCQKFLKLQTVEITEGKK